MIRTVDAASAPVPMLWIEEAHCNRLCKENSDLKKAYADRMKHIDEQHKMIISQNIAENELKEENEKLKMEKRALETSNKELQRVGIANFKDFMKTKEREDELQEDNINLYVEIERISNEHAEKMKRMESQLAEKEKVLEAEHQDFLKLQEHAKNLQASHATAQQQLEEQLMEAKAQLADVAKEKATLEEQNAKLQGEFQQIQTRLATNEKENKLLEATIKEQAVALEEQKTQLEDQLQQLEFTHPSTVEVLAKEVDDGVGPIDLSCYLYNPALAGSIKGPQVVKVATKDYFFYKNQRPSSENHPVWTQLDPIIKEKWTAEWMRMRALQDEQVAKGLIVLKVPLKRNAPTDVLSVNLRKRSKVNYNVDII